MSNYGQKSTGDCTMVLIVTAISTIRSSLKMPCKIGLYARLALARLQLPSASKDAGTQVVRELGTKQAEHDIVRTKAEGCKKRRD